MGTPVEISLAKVILRLCLQLDKHEAPQLSLLHNVLDTLRKKDTPVIAYTKILLQNLPIFIRLIREYNPDVQGSPFSVVLNILRALLRVGNTGSSAYSDAETRRESVSATLFDSRDQTEEGNPASFNPDACAGGVRECLLSSGLMQVVTEAVLSSRSSAVHTVAVGFITDIAMDADACKDSVPQAFVRLASSSRRACKFSAIAILAGICADPASRLLLLRATGPSVRRKWVIDSLPHLWRMLIDSKDGSLQASASEALVLLFTTLGTTEVGDSIAYGLGNIMTMGSDSDGRSILSSLRYVIEESDLHGSAFTPAPDTGTAAMTLTPAVEPAEKSQASPKGNSNWKTLKRTVTAKIVNAPSGGVLAGTRIITRIVEEAKACSAATASLLVKFREKGVHMVLYLCMLRNDQAIQQDQKNLEVLKEARSSGTSGDPCKLFEALTVQEQIVRELAVQGESLLEALRCWLLEDEEAAWMTHMLLQQGGSELLDTGDPGESHASYEGTDCGAPLRQPALGAVLIKSLGAALQLGLRRGAMKRLLDDASPLGADVRGSRATSVYEPANPTRTPRFGDIDALAKSSAIQASSGPSGALGYLLLKKMYENHGVALPTVGAEQSGAVLPPAALSPRDGKALLRAVGPGTLPSAAGCGAVASAFTTAGILLDNNPTALSDQEMTRILQRLGRQIVVTPAAAAKALDKKQRRSLKTQSAGNDSASPRKFANKRIPSPKHPQPPPAEIKPSVARTRPNAVNVLQVTAGKRTIQSPRLIPPSRMQGYSIATLHALADGREGVPARTAPLNFEADNFCSGEGDPLLTVPRRGVGALSVINNQTLDAYMHEMHQRVYSHERNSPQKFKVAASLSSEKEPEQLFSNDIPAVGGLKMHRIKIIRSSTTD